jgi:hypothetical protein
MASTILKIIFLQPPPPHEAAATKRLAELCPF